MESFNAESQSAQPALVISVLKDEVEPSVLARVARKLGLAAHVKYG